METTIKIKLEPFTVPNFVMEDAPIPIQGYGPNESRDPLTLSIKDIDPVTLEKMCDDFRKEVFKKAGKQRPARSREG